MIELSQIIEFSVAFHFDTFGLIRGQLSQFRINIIGASQKQASDQFIWIFNFDMADTQFLIWNQHFNATNGYAAASILLFAEIKIYGRTNK